MLSIFMLSIRILNDVMLVVMITISILDSVIDRLFCVKFFQTKFYEKNEFSLADSDCRRKVDCPSWPFRSLSGVNLIKLFFVSYSPDK